METVGKRFIYEGVPYSFLLKFRGKLAWRGILAVLMPTGCERKIMQIVY